MYHGGWSIASVSGIGSGRPAGMGGPRWQFLHLEEHAFEAVAGAASPPPPPLLEVVVTTTAATIAAMSPTPSNAATMEIVRLLQSHFMFGSQDGFLISQGHLVSLMLQLSNADDGQQLENCIRKNLVTKINSKKLEGNCLKLVGPVPSTQQSRPRQTEVRGVNTSTSIPRPCA
jgi:hypothetical protein